jgi:hypothetical protein
MTPSWMAAGESVELRFPEVLRSSAGIHLLDHYLTSLAPLSDPSPLPEWQRDHVDGAWTYRCTLADGVTFAARVLPRHDLVELTFTVTNGTGACLYGVDPNMCLHLGAAPELASSGVQNRFASFDGELTPLSVTTPSAEEMQRAPWLLILTGRGVEAFQGPRVSPTWWCVDQVADRALMAARSADGRHLIGYGWEGTPATLMTNGNNPCLHAGPAAAEPLAPGETATFRGRSTSRSLLGSASWPRATTPTARTGRRADRHPRTPARSGRPRPFWAAPRRPAGTVRSRTRRPGEFACSEAAFAFTSLAVPSCSG